MRKFFTGICFLLACSLLAACGPKEETKKTPPPEEGESVTEVERWFQLNSTDEGVAADQRLHCEYSKVVATDAGPMVARADVRGSGQCDFSGLAAKAGEPNAQFPDQNFKNILVAIEGEGFDATASKKAKWDCAAIKVTTNKRTLYALDCDLNDRDPAKYKDPLAPEASGSAEEAAFRVNHLVGPVEK